LATIAAALPGTAAFASAPKPVIRPGEVWLDTAGKPIQAHGASILQVGDTFYWYGENKERTLPGSGIWHWGVRAYASKDLVNWADQGSSFRRCPMIRPRPCIRPSSLIAPTSS
jgi:beta-xylosidase